VLPLNRVLQVESGSETRRANADRRLVWINLLGFAGLCGFLFVLKLFASSAVVFDYAKEVYHAQELRWIYDAANPPLYTWLLHVFQKLFGVELWSVLALSLLLLFGIFAAGFALARQALPTVGLAALATWSVMLVGQYHRIQYSMTHSLLAAIACALALWLMLRATRDRRLGDYALLGVVVAVGLLSKFIFLASFLAMIAAALAGPSGRRMALTPKFCVTLLLAAVLSAPIIQAASGGWSRLVEIFQSRSGRDASDGYLTGVLQGFGSLVESAGNYAFLLAIAMAVAILPVFVRRGSPFPTGTVTPEPIAAGWEVKMVRHVLIAGVVFLMVAIVALEVSIVKGRFLHVFLYPLPILAVAIVARHVPGAAGLRRYFWVLAAIGVGTVVVRAVNLSPACLGRCHELVPYDRLAERLSAAGFRQGTILALGVRLGGNLRLRFPASRVDAVVDPFRPAAPPPGRRGQCLIVWSLKGVRDGARLEPLFESAGLAHAGGLRGVKVGTVPVEWRWHGLQVFNPQRDWKARRITWRYVLLPEGTPTCH